jgi:diguanylate cyclase (GGDEF)-like protein/hemerythrin-like metal-binding protein
MTLDLRTLGFVAILSITLQTFALALQWRANRDLSGPGWWALGNAGIMGGLVSLYLMGPMHLGPVMFTVSGIVWTSSLACLYQGVRRFLGQPTRQRLVVALILGVAVSTALFTFVDNHVAYRRGTLALFVTAFSLLITLALGRASPPSRPTRALMGAFVATGAFFLLRSVANFTSVTAGDAPTGGLLPWVLPQTVVVLAVIVLTTLWTYGLILLVGQRRLEEQHEARDALKRTLGELEIERDHAQATARIDSLTQVANRRAFDEALRAEYYRLKRSGAHKLSLLLLDVDHFKRYNDLYGHPAGDACLLQVAAGLRTVVKRAPDLIARYGGEEFAVILPDTDGAGTLAVAERIRRAIEELAIPHSASATAKVVTVSIGAVSITASRVSGPESVLDLADKALYRAKSGGRNRVDFDHAVMAATNSQLPATGLAQLVWREGAVSGNATIDTQHKQLFAAANELLSALVEGRSTEVCSALLEVLRKGIETHLSTEEAILRDAGYPATEVHARGHEALLARVAEMAAEYARDEVSIGELFSFLADEVVVQHLFVDDADLFEHLAGTSADGAPPHLTRSPAADSKTSPGRRCETPNCSP